MVKTLSEGELARRTGTSPDGVRRLVSLGILELRDGAFTEADISRVRLAEALDLEGVSFEDMGRAIAAGELSFGWFQGLLPSPVGLTGKTHGQLWTEIGLPPSVVERLYALWGLAIPPPDSPVREDDEAILWVGRQMFDALGRDESALADATRYFGENIRRIAESQVAFFRTTVLDPLLASAPTPQAAIETASAVSDVARPAAERLIAWLHTRHFEAALVQLVVQIVETTMESAGYARRRPTVLPAIAFLDLSGYTRLTEDAGDEAAARLATGLADLVGEAAAAHGGRPVKLLGDGVMFHFADPARAAACGLDLVRRAQDMGLPPARVGVSAGPVVFRDGDYFGSTVNLAARIVEYARPREVLVTEDVVEASSAGDVEFRPIGSVPLKGLAQPIALHSAKARSPRR